MLGTNQTDYGQAPVSRHSTCVAVPRFKCMGRHGDSQRDARRLRTMPGPELELVAVLGRFAREEGEKEKMPQTNPFSPSLKPLTRIPPPKMASLSARRRRVRELPDTLSYFYLRLILRNNVADREQLLRRTHSPAGWGSPDATGSSYAYPDSLAFPARPVAFRSARYLESPGRDSDNRRA